MNFPDVFSFVAPLIWARVDGSGRLYVCGKAKKKTFITYHFDHASHAIRDRDLGLLQTQGLSTRIAHVRLDPAAILVRSDSKNPKMPRQGDDSPRVEGESGQLRILKVDLERDVVQSRFGRAVGGVGEVALLHVRQAGRGGAERDELGRFGMVEEGQDGLEEVDDAAHVDFEVLPDIGNLDLADGWEDLGDTSVGDDDIQSRDAVIRL